MDEIHGLDAEVIAISSEIVDHAREAAEAYAIEFPLLADTELEVIDAYGLRHEEGGIYGDIARPATLVVDRDGNIVWRDLTDNWRARPRVEDVIEILAGLD